ncbi:hypothetical protein ACFSJW_06590 [Flavobacterium artemisiae]|uniref:Uncharacterized protein n=1 Tax=Flavobacterium artemisiae TaxID=2126556 RepID=A0ABW4HCM7_9FLAO
MKKALLLLLVIPFSNYGQSSKILDFNAGYAPETTYNQTTYTSSNYEVTYTGSEEILEVFKKNGATNPTKINKKYGIETQAKTGKIDKDGNFPITIEYLQSLDENGTSIIPSGTMLFGKASASSMPQMDSIVANNTEESFKNALFETVKSMFSQVIMPQKKLKIGESFTQENPLTIPVAGINFEMIINTTYTLKRMTAKEAFFDIVQTYTIKLIESRFDTSGSGTGSGKLIYDIPNHFISENNLDMEFDLNLKHTDFGINLISKSGYRQTVKISKN